MNEFEVNNPAESSRMSKLSQHRFLLLIIGTVIISIVLVAVSLFIYNTSGSAQLDFSRPGLESVSKQVERNRQTQDFPTTGTITTGTIDDFLNLYDDQSAKAKAVDAFNGDPLNPDVLEFTDLPVNDAAQ
jgi:hypothetical protein